MLNNNKNPVNTAFFLAETNVPDYSSIKKKGEKTTNDESFSRYYYQVK